MQIFTTNSYYYSASGHFYYWVLLQFPQILIILNAYYNFLLNYNFELNVSYIL